MSYPFVSIVVPALNEEKNLSRLFKSLRELKYPKEKYEIIIVDGGSRDRTVSIAKESGAKVFLNPKRLRGAGCQIGVEEASGEYIAFTDADCVVPGDWLVKLVGVFKGDWGNKGDWGMVKVVSVGGPNVTPKEDTPFAKAAGEVIGFLTKAGARYGYRERKAREVFHNSGCNVVYNKKAILRVGGFNKDLVTCEDEELDYRLKEKGYKLFFTPDVVVDHYRRPNFKKILVQAYRFAFGRAQAIKIHLRMSRWFHFLPTLLLMTFLSPLIFLGSPVFVYSILYLVLVFSGFLLVSYYLSFSRGHKPFFVYFLLLWCWIIGWGVGFGRGLLR